MHSWLCKVPFGYPRPYNFCRWTWKPPLGLNRWQANWVFDLAKDGCAFFSITAHTVLISAVIFVSLHKDSWHILSAINSFLNFLYNWLTVLCNIKVTYLIWSLIFIASITLPNFLSLLILFKDQCIFSVSLEYILSEQASVPVGWKFFFKGFLLIRRLWCDFHLRMCWYPATVICTVFAVSVVIGIRVFAWIGIKSHLVLRVLCIK